MLLLVMSLVLHNAFLGAMPGSGASRVYSLMILFEAQGENKFPFTTAGGLTLFHL